MSTNTRGLGFYFPLYLVLQAHPLGASRKVSPAMEILGMERVGKIKAGAGIGPKTKLQDKSSPNEVAISKYHFTPYHHAVSALTEF
jgi:hypothetical protein